MKTTIYSLITTGLLLLASCSTPSSTQTANSGVKPYPLQVCIVTGNDLESMGGAITKVHSGQQIKFCCEPCVEKFDANPAKYLAKLN
jgi:YHS domain-containing protein